MIKRANLKEGSVNVGDIVQIGINRVYLAKTDCKNLTLMVVEEKIFKKNLPICHLGNKLMEQELLPQLRI